MNALIVIQVRDANDVHYMPAGSEGGSECVGECDMFTSKRIL
jgi:hypothetical protein